MPLLHLSSMSQWSIHTSIKHRGVGSTAVSSYSRTHTSPHHTTCELHTHWWKLTPDLSMTQGPKLLPALKPEHSWNNKPCTANDTLVKKNAWSSAEDRGVQCVVIKKDYVRRFKRLCSFSVSGDSSGDLWKACWGWQKHYTDMSDDYSASDRTFIFPSSSLPPIQWLEKDWGTIWLHAATATAGTQHLVSLCCFLHVEFENDS